MVKILKKNASDVRREIEKLEMFGVAKDSMVNVIFNDDTIVGFIYYSFNLEDSEIAIDVIEILKEFRGKSYGKEAIKQLFKIHPGIKKIKGLSNPDAVGFWAKMGADFTYSCEECSYDACTEHPEFDKSKWDENDIALGRCDDYSEDNFILYRDTLLM